MSYDLYFTSPNISRGQFQAYFSQHPRYQITDSQAWYGNEDTGVYFSFEHNDAPPEEEDDIAHSVMFNMNFYRPHYFALEAEPEVHRFVEHFDCSIHDPQNDGMGDSPYSSEGFLRGWNHGNEFAFSAFFGSNDAPSKILCRPADELEKIWRWNHFRESVYERLEEDIFIPRIIFLNIDGTLGSASVWPDAISTLIPKVDYLYIPREELAPKKWFGGRREDVCVVPLADALGVLQEYATAEHALEAFKLPAPRTTEQIKDYVRGLPPYRGSVEAIALDQVLDCEYVEKYAKTR